MKEEKYSLELYITDHLQRELKLRTNMIYFNEINGPIPQIGWNIEVPREIMEMDNNLTQTEITVFSTNKYKVTDITGTLAKTKKGLDTKVKVIGKLL